MQLASRSHASRFKREVRKSSHLGHETKVVLQAGALGVRVEAPDAAAVHIAGQEGDAHLFLVRESPVARQQVKRVPQQERMVLWSASSGPPRSHHTRHPSPQSTHAGL